MRRARLPPQLLSGVVDRIPSDLAEIRFSRHGASFCTYGLPAYQADTDSPEYRLEALRCNPVLLRHFAGLYAHLLDSLSGFFQRRVRFHSQLAVPGLHYFSAESLEHFSGGSPHHDYSFFQRDWEYRGRHVAEHASVVVVLDAPVEGAFLEFYGCRAEPLEGRFPDLGALASEEPMRRERVASGSLIVFDGLEVHRIGPSPANAQQRPRITLQGHLFPNDQELIFYW